MKVSETAFTTQFGAVNKLETGTATIQTQESPAMIYRKG